VVANILLATIKFAVGIIGHSQAVVADAVHSLSDLVTDFIILIGVGYWNRPPDDTHPYGHRRIETLVSVTIGLLLATVGAGLIFKAFKSIGNHAGHNILWLAIVGPALSIIVKGILYKITLDEGRRIPSGAVVANAFHHRSDAISSIPVLISVLLATLHPAWIYFDSLGSVFISVFIFRDAYKILAPALLELQDGSNPDEVPGIEQRVEGIKGVRSVHGTRIRTHGENMLLDIHVMVDPNISVKDGHSIAGRVKHDLMRHNDRIVDVVVHIEPSD
jgi:cation diffusion facilitator family transporter